MNCYCDLSRPFDECCGPYLKGEKTAPDPVSLMRSRYSAYASQNLPYILKTWHPKFAPGKLQLDAQQHWIGLKIIESNEHHDQGEVKFVARYKVAGKGHRLEEHSLFSRIDGRWYYLHSK